MAVHTEYSLRGPSISEILNLPLTISTLEAVGAKCLIAGKNGKVFNLVHAAAAAVSAVIAYEGAVAKQQEVRVGIEKSIACVAAEAVDVPSVSGW